MIRTALLGALLGALILCGLAAAWGVIVTAAIAFGFVPMLLAGFVLLLGLVLAYEVGPNGAWAKAQKARRRDNLRDIALRAQERDPFSETGRSVLGTPRDWGDAA